MKIVVGAFFFLTVVLLASVAQAQSLPYAKSSLLNIDLKLDNPYPGQLPVRQSVTPVGASYSCPALTGSWICQDVTYGSTKYKFRIRYNLSTVTPTDHVIFSLGSYLSSYNPEVKGVEILQDKMAAQNVRTYEIEVTSFDIYNPIATAPNTSMMMAALVDYIRAKYAANDKVKLITYDYSATLVSYALAYHKLEDSVDQVFLLGGPAGFNYMRELFDPTTPPYLNDADRIVKINDHSLIDVIIYVNDWRIFPVCRDMGNCDDKQKLDSASMFSEYFDSNMGVSYSDVPFNEVDLKYPGVKIHNIIGANDLSWFKNSSQFWYERITPGSKTRDIVTGAAHNIFSSEDTIKKILAYLSLKDVEPNPGNTIITDKTAPTAATSVSVKQTAVIPFMNTRMGIEVVPHGATDAVGISHYEVYRDGSYVGMAKPNTVFTDKTVIAGTLYSYTVKTIDLAGNESPLSAPSYITTFGTASTTSSYGTPSPIDIAVNENPSIVSVGVYQMEEGTVFNKNTYSDLKCIDNQDGDIKNNLVITHNIPTTQTVGDTYQVSFSCTDSKGNTTGPITSTVQIVPAGSVSSSNPGGNVSPVGNGSGNIESTTPYTYSPPTANGKVVSGGLVPCGDAGEPSCQFCHAVSLIDNVVGWLAKILSIVATIIFVVGGVRMVVSVGDVKVKQTVKKLIENTAIGLMIVLAAWIIIDFILQSLVGTTFSAFAPWLTIQCP